MGVESVESRQALRYIRKYFYKHDEFSHMQVLRMLLSEVDTPPEVLRAMAHATGQVELLEKVAVHPNTPRDVVERLARHTNRNVRMAASSRSS